jgi:hypothetical protein
MTGTVYPTAARPLIPTTTTTTETHKNLRTTPPLSPPFFFVFASPQLTTSRSLNINPRNNEDEI